MPLNPLLFCVTHKTQPTEFQLQQACIVISRPNSIYRYFIKQKPSSSIILTIGGLFLKLDFVALVVSKHIFDQ